MCKGSDQRPATSERPSRSFDPQLAALALIDRSAGTRQSSLCSKGTLMGQNSSNAHLYWALGGAAAGFLVSRSQLDASKRSRSETDDPVSTADTCEEIADLLEAWEPSADCETEDDFTNDLADYLCENSDRQIEVCPDTPEGQPDILIDDLLALELKVDPGKSERDRLIGQCAGYSRLWVTWAIVIDATDSRVGRLVDLLEDKGLEHIAVWSF